MRNRVYGWIIAVLAVSALAVVLPIMAAGGGDNSKAEQEVTLQDCPQAVQKAIKDNSQGGEIVEIEKETTKDGKVVYEAEVKKPDGKKFDVKVSEDGRLIATNDDDDDDQDEDDD